MPATAAIKETRATFFVRISQLQHSPSEHLSRVPIRPANKADTHANVSRARFSRALEKKLIGAADRERPASNGQERRVPLESKAQTAAKTHAKPRNGGCCSLRAPNRGRPPDRSPIYSAMLPPDPELERLREDVRKLTLRMRSMEAFIVLIVIILILQAFAR